MNKTAFIALSLFVFFCLSAKAQDTLWFKGQFSNWLLLNSETELPFWGGSRYIPQLNYETKFKDHKLLDFEISANIFGTAATNFNSLYTNGDIKPYRLWARFSGKQFELRLGLQKINFGSATMLRPLMWFDGVDARDPLSITDGVYGLLGRYYFLNNANIWLWGLYGNNNTRGFEFIPRKENSFEFGGRIQIPAGNSEMGFTYHYNTLNSSGFESLMPAFAEIGEHKFGYDIKVDWVTGLWFEAGLSVLRPGSANTKAQKIGSYKNQEFITLGADYTFGIGNGIYTVFEHFIGANDEKIFRFAEPINFSALMATYPVGMFDNLSAMLYYDWANGGVYSFLNWQKQFNKSSLHFIAFWNPETISLPTAQSDINLFGGKGIQIMFVYNH